MAANTQAITFTYFDVYGERKQFVCDPEKSVYDDTFDPADYTFKRSELKPLVLCNTEQTELLFVMPCKMFTCGHDVETLYKLNAMAFNAKESMFLGFKDMTDYIRYFEDHTTENRQQRMKDLVGEWMDKACYSQPGVSNLPRRLQRLIADTALLGKWDMVPVSVSWYKNAVEKDVIDRELGDFGSLLPNGCRTPRGACYDHLRRKCDVLFSFPCQENKVYCWMDNYELKLKTFAQTPLEEHACDSTPDSEEAVNHFNFELAEVNMEFLKTLQPAKMA